MSNPRVNFTLSATNKAGAAFSSVTSGMKKVAHQQQRITRTNVGFMRGMSANRRIVQQVGMQVSDLGVQIAGGQSALLSLTQNVPQVVQMFGAFGGILAAVITLLGTATLMFVKSGQSMIALADTFGIAKDDILAFRNMLVTIKEAVFNMVNFVVNHLDVMLASLSALAVFMGAKYVSSAVSAAVSSKFFALSLRAISIHGYAAGGSMVALRAATIAFNSALAVTRKLLMRLGLPALIIGAGYLIERLTTLRSIVGSWGEVFSMVAAVAIEILIQRIPRAAEAMGYRIAGTVMSLPVTFSRAFASIFSTIINVINKIIGAFNGLWDASSIIFDEIASHITNVFMSAFEGVMKALRRFINAIIDALNQLPGMNLSRIEGDWGKFTKKTTRSAKELGADISDAMSNSLSRDFLPGAQKVLNSWKRANDSAGKFVGEVFGKASEAASEALAPLKSWEKLMGALSQDKGGQFDIRNLFGGGNGSDDAEKTVGKIGEKINFAMRSVLDLGKTVSTTLKSNLGDLLFGVKSFRRALSDALNDISRKVLDFGINQLFKTIENNLFGGGGFDEWVKKIFSKTKDEDVSKTLFDEIKKVTKSLFNDIGSKSKGVINSFVGLLRNFFSGIGNVFSNINVGGSFSGLAGFVSRMFSFDGGGFTGAGVRSGGLDGKGGRVAMVHPNETIIDHAKRNGAANLGMASRKGSTVVVNATYQFNGVSRDEVMRDVQNADSKLKRTIIESMPGYIDQHSFNKQRGAA